MNNRMLLQQARKAIAFQIAQSPDTFTVRRITKIPDGFGGMMDDPYGVPTDVVCLVRISHEITRGGVHVQQEQPSGVDTSLGAWLLGDSMLVLNEGEIGYSMKRHRWFKVGVIDALIKFEGVQAYQAPLYPAGDVPSGAVTGVALNGDDPQPLAVADTFQLVPIFTPESVVDTSGVWVSGDESKATVSQSGLVTGVEAGPALIAFITNDGGFTAARLFQVFG